MIKETPLHFATLSDEDRAHGALNRADDETLAMMARCVANQQAAGFKDHIDLRQVPCSDCGAAGFNTGWGFFKHVCGAEILSDGEMGEPCRGSPRRTGMSDTALPPGPFHYMTTAPEGEHHGKGHVYICDANGRKIAVCWGPPDTKMATAELIITARGEG